MTNFVRRYGNFKFLVMPFGLMNALSSFQRMMDEVLSDIPFALVYLDDVVIFSSDMERHVEHLRKVLRAIAAAVLKLKITKCNLAMRSVSLLGHVVGATGFRVSSHKIKAIGEATKSSSTT